MRLKKALSWVLALSFSLAAPALATDTSFSDVQPGAWYYDYVTQCASRGLMSGMGDGTFSPGSKMTVGQFIRVAVSAVYPAQVNSAKQKEEAGAPWWNAYYTVADNNTLISRSDYDRTEAAMNAPITRQEMAKIAAKVTLKKGEKFMTLTDSTVIADYDSIDDDFKYYVVDCFAKGILAGVDDKGTFNPNGALTRGEASVVILHMVDASTRVVPDLNAAPVTEKHEWREGEVRTNLPQAGDVVIKADGTRVTLEIGPGGVLGACQGVDIYSGITLNNGPIKLGGIYGVIGQTPLRKDSITGEVHTEDDWVGIKAALSPSGKYVGNYNGEVFNTWFKWDSAINMWIWIGPSC